VFTGKENPFPPSLA